MTKTLDQITAFSDKQREDLKAIVEHTAETVRKPGPNLAPVVFLFNTERNEINLVGAEDFTSGDAKDVFAEAVRSMARVLDADMTVFISESWGLSNEDALDYQDNQKKYPGGIADHPNHYEIVAFMIETKGGSWLGQARISREGDGRRMEAAEFLDGEVSGRFTNFLDRSNTH